MKIRLSSRVTASSCALCVAGLLALGPAAVADEVALLGAPRPGGDLAEVLSEAMRETRERFDENNLVAGASVVGGAKLLGRRCGGRRLVDRRGGRGLSAGSWRSAAWISARKAARSIPPPGRVTTTVCPAGAGSTAGGASAARSAGTA